MFWVADLLKYKLWRRFFMLSMLSINPGIWLYSVEMVETGEIVDSTESPVDRAVCGK